MPYNVPDDQKSTFNQKVKNSLGLLAADVGRTLGQLQVLQPETLVEEYQKPIEPQATETVTPSEEGIAPIVSEYNAPYREDIMSVTPYQQMARDAVSADTDSFRNENGEIVSSPMEVFSKPLDASRVKVLGLVDDEGKPTEKGNLFFNLSEAGMFDVSGKITDKGIAYLTPTEELGKPENLKAFQTLWDDQVIRPSASLGEITAGTVGFLQDAIAGGGKRIGQEAQSVWYNSQTWSSLLGQTDRRPKELRDKMTASGLGLIEGAVENLSGWAGMADVGAAWIGKKLYDVLPVGMEDEAEQAMYAARQRQWQTQQDIANLEAGEIAETVLGFDNATKQAQEAKSSMGEKAFNEQYKQAGAFSQIAADPTNLVPASLAVKASRMAPLANRLSITAQKRMAKIAAQDLAIAEGRTVIEAANAVLKKEAATVSIANRLSSDISSRVGANPELVMRANQASQVASRITQSAEQIRSALPSVTAELEGLVAKRNSLATRIPEAYAQKTLQTMEIGRQVRSMPAKAVGATLERVGDALSKTDDAVTNFLQERGLDQMYTAAVGAAGIAGMAGSPVIGTVAAGAAALKAGKVLSSYGKLFRYVGKEMENVRGQIPFWKRVASHTAPNSLGRGIAHTFNMLDLGGVTSDVIRRTGRGMAAAAPTDLMFEYLSDGADMRPETLYQAAAESLVIGGSFAAAGGAFMGTKRRMRELAIGDELNFKRDLVDDRQKALFDAIPSGTRRAISTYAIANPTLNYQFKDSGASQYDPNTNTATINVKSTNPIKALVAHETLHHTIIKNNMESGISALFLGDMKENTVGGLFRSRDGKLDPNFEAFKDAYYKRLGVAEMSNAERDAIYPLDKVAVEYFIEKHSDQYSEMAESGELGAIAASGTARRKLGSILETILPRVPVLRDLHFKSGGMIDRNGSWVTGNGILDAEGIKTDPITNKMFRDMNRRSAGLATGQFEPLVSDKPDSGASIILNPSDSIDSELLHPLVKTDENGKPIFENGKPIALDKSTELERALAGLTVNEVLRRKRSENYVPEKGEAFIDDSGEFQAGWLGDDVVSAIFAKNRFNPEQKRIIREMNRLVQKGTGDRVVMINFPATTRNKAGKVIYKTQQATLRDTVPVAILTSKDGNLLFGLMSVTKLKENIQKRSQSVRGKRLYSGNVDLILKDTEAMMQFHKSGTDSIEYFSEKYGAVEADQRKKFINTMFGLLNQKEQAVLNPMLLEDGVKSRDNVYRTYRADRVSKAVPMAPEDYPAMPFSYKATSQVLLPEQARRMPEDIGADQFYSQLERVVSAKLPSRATPQQIMATIDPTRGSGVKADEIKWSGIEQAMESLKKDGKVSKEDLLNYLRDEGQVKFEEVRSEAGESIGSQDFSTFVLEGGKNYREIVLAMPSTSKPQFVIAYKDGSGQLGGMTFDTKEQAQAEMSDTFPRRTDLEVQSFYREKPISDYTSTHFPSIPNYVAHMRTDERVDSNGKEGLFVEEFQSDRHQEGRRKGYANERRSQKEIGAELDDLNKRYEDAADSLTSREWERLNDQIDNPLATDPKVIEINRIRAELSPRILELRREYNAASSSLPADAPFRTTWPLQLFKRALRDAVNSGKDWIGWTDGKTQNDRFKLSKYLDSLKVTSYPIGNETRYDLIASKDNEDTFNKQEIPESQLADIVGKEFADKIIKDNSGVTEEKSKTYSGVNLEVGGSGMKGFYDNMLPKEIGKYVNTLGGGKVEKSTMQYGEADIPSWDKWHLETYGQEVDASIDDATLDARYEGWTNLRNAPKTASIWKVEITPEMRKAAQAGQARFMPESVTGKTKRIPEVTEAAQKLKEGKITAQEYNAIVDQYMPLKSFGRVLEPASTSDILRGLGDRKAGERYKRDMVKNPEDIPAGKRLESRLDIPAYESEGVYVNALHEPRKDVNKGGAGTAVGYTATTVMDNVNFGVTEKAAENIAAGKPKGTIATMQGDYVPMTVKQAHDLAKKVIGNPRWTEVGMNPIRHSYFYDKATQLPIESAKQVIQIGALVLAKDAVKGKKSDYRYMPEVESEPVKVVGRSNELTVQGTPAPKTSVKTIPLSGKVIKWDDKLKTGVRYMPEYKPSAFPIITPKILADIEKETPTLAAIHIDRMRVGNYMGIDLQGGMYYPAITENLEKQVLWAFNSKGVARTVAARAAENNGYVKLILMQEGNVVGNKTFNDIWFEVLNRSIKANKISKKSALDKLNEMRERVYKKLSSKDAKRNPWILDHSQEWKSISEASEAIRSMPQIERGSTYFQKTKVMTKSAGEKMSYQALLSKKMTKAGFPDAEEIVENIEEPAFKGVPSGAAVAIIKFNPLQEGADIMTAKDAGVTEHRSYGYVLHGVPVAKINHYQVIDRTFPSTKNQIMTQQHTNFPVRKSIPSESLSHGSIKYATEKSKAKLKSSASAISSVAKMK